MVDEWPRAVQVDQFHLTGALCRLQFETEMVPATNFGDSEITNKDGALGVQEDVLGLQVAVHDVDRMQILLHRGGGRVWDCEMVNGVVP